MEFKLNKIDIDIRKKMQEEIKEDKVHSGKEINVKKELKDEENKNTENMECEKKEKRYITINGVKYNHKNISIPAEKIEEINDENSKGRILDKKK